MKKVHEMMRDKRIRQVSAGAVFAALAFLSLGSPARADGSAVPGRAVGHVFLGMERADVWKILGRPSHTATVPHGMSLYGEDYWNGEHGTLTVVSERDKVIQIEFDSPNFTTTDGLSTNSTLAQIRRRHPSMTVRSYVLLFFGVNYGTREDGYYIDDVRRGIAFTTETQEAIQPIWMNYTPDTIIIHRAGDRAVSIFQGHWSNPEKADKDPGGLRLLRLWFTPRGR